MEIGVGLIVGLLVGAAIAFIVVQAFLKKQHQDKIDEMNRNQIWLCRKRA